MGFSAAYFAVKGKARDVVLAECGLKPTGQTEEVFESPVDGLELPSGWYLVIENRPMPQPFADDALLQRLSADGAEVLNCFVEEHVMFSSAERWVDGRRQWSVSHNGGEDGLEHLVVAGAPPAEFHAISSEALAQLNADPEPCDYVFDVAPLLFKQFTGFKYDEDAGKPFEVLEFVGGLGGGGGKKPWWKVW